MVTFETKVWEKDWEYILKGNYLNNIISVNNFRFAKKQIIINNVKNRNLVEKFCEKKVKEGVIDCYFSVEDFEAEVLKHFDLKHDSFKGGYYYSIAELLGIYKCQTKYLLHYSGDSYLKKTGQNWINDAIEVMEQNANIWVANPSWKDTLDEAKNESFDEIEKFYLGYGFSDQCYLVRTEDFSQKIYNDKNPISERYPKYGGELFEKRVDAFMRNNEKIRITHKFTSYVHKNFRSDWISRKIIRNQLVEKRLIKMKT
jgi:hypothetical protein